MTVALELQVSKELKKQDGSLENTAQELEALSSRAILSQIALSFEHMMTFTFQAMISSVVKVLEVESCRENCVNLLGAS